VAAELAGDALRAMSDSRLCIVCGASLKGRRAQTLMASRSRVGLAGPNATPGRRWAHAVVESMPSGSPLVQLPPVALQESLQPAGRTDRVSSLSTLATHTRTAPHIVSARRA
jgi:hypothetical protein